LQASRTIFFWASFGTEPTLYIDKIYSIDEDLFDVLKSTSAMECEKMSEKKKVLKNGYNKISKRQFSP